MNDISIAAVTLTNGDRRLFFQDTSGAIRESIYSFAADQWEADIGNIVATDARNNTPIATFDILSELGDRSSTAMVNHEEVRLESTLPPLHKFTEDLQIFLLYITRNSTLALRYFSLKTLGLVILLELPASPLLLVLDRSLQPHFPVSRTVLLMMRLPLCKHSSSTRTPTAMLAS